MVAARLPSQCTTVGESPNSREFESAKAFCASRYPWEQEYRHYVVFYGANPGTEVSERDQARINELVWFLGRDSFQRDRFAYWQEVAL